MEDFDVELTDNVKEKKKCFCVKGLFIFGFIVFLIGFLDMTVIYLVPFLKTKENQNKYPDAYFEKPEFLVILIHFLLNGTVTLIGVLLVTTSFIQPHKACSGFFLIVSFILSAAAFSMWIAEINIDFSKTNTFKYETLKITQLSSIMKRNPPIDFIFFYSKDLYYQIACPKDDCQIVSADCYSKSGVSMPIKSNLIKSVYDLTNVPDVFKIKINQELRMSDDLQMFFDEIKNTVETCDMLHQKVFDYYPLISDIFLVSRNKVPSYLNSKTRTASIIFGVGAFYELSYKSIPLFIFNQISNGTIDLGINYTQIKASFDCRKLGECSINNKRPKP